jgi:exodeoxyribonuclease VII large subunit
MASNSSENAYSVAAISQILKTKFEDLPEVWIEGELSQVNYRPGAGIMYMRLKDSDEDMSVSIHCYRNLFDTFQGLEANAKIKVKVRLSYWAKNGSISFLVSDVEKVGVGDLLAKLEALKEKLAKEGLFDPERKKPLPFLPKKVGVICGRNSDAEKDVVQNAKRRWPSVQFVIKEVAVASASAVKEVSAALKELETAKDIDVIVITRGGGSFEDLLPFSDESLLRLVASCKTPIVSAIGHEKDSPILDLVADYRASTPTDAGKRIVPDMFEELSRIDAFRARAIRYLDNRISNEMHRVEVTRTRSFQGISNRIAIGREQISKLLAQITALSPQATLNRGYSVIQKADGTVVKKASQFTKGETLRLRLAEGEGTATSN